MLELIPNARPRLPDHLSAINRWSPRRRQHGYKARIQQSSMFSSYQSVAALEYDSILGQYQNGDSILLWRVLGKGFEIRLNVSEEFISLSITAQYQTILRCNTR